jgi:amino acid transporter
VAKGVLLAVVLPLSIVVNSFRIFATGMLHLWGYPELAENLFHDFAGLVIFLLAATILFGVSMVLKRFGPDSAAPPKPETVNREPETVFNPNVPNDQNGWKKPVAATAILCLLFVGSGQALQRLPSARNLPERTSLRPSP